MAGKVEKTAFLEANKIEFYGEKGVIRIPCLICVEMRERSECRGIVQIRTA